VSITVVSNATPIISFCSVKYEFVLKELFQRIIIPEAVEQELRNSDKPGADFMKLDWVQVVSPENQELVLLLRKDIDQGEAATIALAKQINADAVLIDEYAGYQIAKFLSLPVTRTLSVLKTAKNKKIINRVRRPAVEEMIQKGRWYSKEVIEKFLYDVGE